jgi:hypothetical protein
VQEPKVSQSAHIPPPASHAPYVPPARHFPFAQQPPQHAPHATACLQLFLTVPQRPLQVLALDSDRQIVMVLLDLVRRSPGKKGRHVTGPQSMVIGCRDIELYSDEVTHIQ